jgi:hypothetical protein
MAAQSGLVCSPEAEKKAREVFEQLYARRDEQFGNAREMRNYFETAVRNQSSRLVGSGNFAREALTTLLPEDLPTDFSSIPSPPETKPTRSRIAPRPG